jgi:hypothetical protein
MRYLSVIVVLIWAGALLAQGDNCNTAITINTLPFVTQGNTTGLTNDYSFDEGNPITGHSTYGPDIVYQFTYYGDSTCFVLNVLIPEDFWNAAIYVFANNCDMSNAIAGVDQFGPGSPEALYVMLFGGNTYYFVVDGRDTSDYGVFTFALSNCATDVDENEITLEGTELTVYPSVTRDESRIILNLRKPEWVNLNLYDVSGRRVVNIYSGELKKGEHIFEGRFVRELKAGIYFIKLETPSESKIERINVIH